jgi:hypothetical protein
MAQTRARNEIGLLRSASRCSGDERLATHASCPASARHGHSHSTAARIPLAERGDRVVVVRWEDGKSAGLCVGPIRISPRKSAHTSSSHHIWLRDHCRCPTCFHAVTKQRLYSTFEVSGVTSSAYRARDLTRRRWKIPPDVTPADVEATAEGLRVTCERALIPCVKHVVNAPG